MSEMTIAEFCTKHNACADGWKWAIATGCTTMAEIWQRDDLRLEWRKWIATQPGLLTDRELRLYACWCVRQVWHLLTDERSRTAVEVAERYADGLSTDAELAAARDAAGAAAWSAAGVAAQAAARVAAQAAAEAAAWAAGAAGAEWSAERAARSAAEATEWSAARAAQSKWLLENTKPQFVKEGRRGCSISMYSILT